MSKNTNLSFLTDYITADITNGRIGINTPSPTVAFDVTGATKITGVLTLTSTISNGTYAYTLPSATGTLALTSALSGTTNYVAKFTSSSAIGNSLIYDDATNIGIGTTTPNQLLCLRKTSVGAETIALALQNVGNTTGTAISMTFAPHDSGNPSTPEPLAKISAYRVTNIDAITDLLFYTYGVGGLTEKMRILSSGNIGINTSTNYTLGNVGNRGITINGNSACVGYVQLASANTSYAIWYAYSAESAFYTSANIPLWFGTNNTERMRVHELGNILINTTTNNALGNNGNKGITINSGGENLASFISFRTSNADRGIMYANDSEMLIGSQTTIPLLFTTNNVEAIRITSAQNVGIGTSSPTSKLDVRAGTSIGLTLDQTNGTLVDWLRFSYTNRTGNYGSFRMMANGVNYIIGPDVSLFAITGGNILMGTTTDNGERLYVSGAIRATGSITANSDISLKKNLLKIENALEKIEQINGYTYELKEDDSKRHGGVIAQEIDKVFPEIVNKGNDGILGVEYGNISALLIEAIKELKQEINILKQK